MFVVDARQGLYAYLIIGATTGGLVIVDISNPSAPQRVWEYDTYYPAQGIKIYDVYAYIVGSNIEVLVLEISHPSAPKLAGALESNTISWQVVGTGDVIFTASGGLKVFTRQ